VKLVDPPNVNPATIAKFTRVGQLTPPAGGRRWVCKNGGVDLTQTFREEVGHAWRGDINGLFDRRDRADHEARVTRCLYTDLRGEVENAPKVYTNK
jgi:hypothetical protein